MAPEQPIVTLIIPVYYEQDNIVPLFRQIKRFVSVPHRAVVIYDYDDDPTLLRTEEVLQIDPNARFIKNKYSPGIINAFKTGFQLEDSEYIVPIMADLSDSPETIDRMYERILEGYDVVVASRYMRGGGKIGGPFLKYLLSKAANLSLHKLSGIPTHDMTNAFIMHRKSVLDQFELRSTGGFEVTMEILAKSYILGYRITEVATVNHDRNSGKSNFKIWKWMRNYLYWYFYILIYSAVNRVSQHYVRDARRRTS